jgi:hypothetical protein
MVDTRPLRAACPACDLRFAFFTASSSGKGMTGTGSTAGIGGTSPPLSFLLKLDMILSVAATPVTFLIDFGMCFSLNFFIPPITFSQ